MSEYRFLGFDTLERQANGFFVDRDDRIAYWPNSRAPGYEIPLDLARKLSSHTRLASMPRRPLTWDQCMSIGVFAAVIAVATFVFLTIDPHRQFFDYVFMGAHDRFPDLFSDMGSVGVPVTGICLISVPIASILRIWTSRSVGRLREWISSHSNVIEIHQPRPKPIRLRLDDIRAEGPAPITLRIIIYLSGGVFLAVGIVLLFYVPFVALRWGDQVVGVLLGALLVYVSASCLISLTFRPSVRDLETLDSTTFPNEIEEKPRAIPLSRRMWRNVMNTVGYILFGAVSFVVLIALREQPSWYDPHEALDAFCRGVIWSTPDSVTTCDTVPENATLMRWTYRPSVHLTHGDPDISRFAKRVRDHISAALDGAGLNKEESGIIRKTIEIVIRRPVQDERLAGSIFTRRVGVNAWSLQKMEFDVNFFEARASRKSIVEREIAQAASGLHISALENYDSFLVNWSLIDTKRLTLEILYDSRMRSGMPAGEAIILARQILDEIYNAGGLDEWRGSRP
ncbi:MAG: hypothetical protein R8L07_20635 [Alphaproteobacteria bacterium]|nr:hypothetical protein [Alphaproteobacteria bacterium]